MLEATNAESPACVAETDSKSLNPCNANYEKTNDFSTVGH